MWYWRRLLGVSWTARKPKQSILKEINSEYSLEGLMLKLELQYFGHLMWKSDSLEKSLMLGKTEIKSEGSAEGWEGWMASPTQWVWVWTNSRKWLRTGMPDMWQLTGVPKSWLFASGGQSIGAPASASVLPMNIQDWFPLGWTGWISLQSRDSKKSSPTPQFKSINSLVLSFLYGPTLKSIHDYWKNHSLD